MTYHESRKENVAYNLYSNFFSTLYHYGNSLDDYSNNIEKSNDDNIRNLQVLSTYSFNLIEYSRAHAQLIEDDDKVANLLWDLAVNIQEFTNNLYDTNKIIDKRIKITEFSAIINEIVTAENQARMSQKNIGFEKEKEEVYSLISPKITQAIEVLE
ncbi:hypothetical protein [Desulfuribacillus stibiiarsenatis]|nr:hypothetical protein [Desulfuribacillus stibiiarsenatis]